MKHFDSKGCPQSQQQARALTSSPKHLRRMMTLLSLVEMLEKERTPIFLSETKSSCLLAEGGVALDSGACIFGGALGKGAPELVSPLGVSVAELGDVGDEHGYESKKLLGGLKLRQNAVACKSVCEL
jgi:hypothetical protein